MKLLLALVLAAPAFAAEKDLPAYRPPVEDEAHGLKGAERELAMHVYGSHYRNMLRAFGLFTLPGRDLKDPAKPSYCDVKMEIRPADFRPGSFVDGLPVRRAQPIVFNSFQQQVVEGIRDCEKAMAVSSETWKAIEDRSLDLLVENSGTTYCRSDSDCYGTEIAGGLCGDRRTVRVYGSNTTDAVFFIAFRKFMPSLLSMLGPNACPTKHWGETPLDAVCVEHSCRARD